MKILNTMTIRNKIIRTIERNKISTTEVGDVLDKTGQIEGVHALNRGKYAVGEVALIYAINNSNYEVHRQLANKNLEDKIVFVYNVNCSKAIFGELVSKYILLYKRAKAIVVNGLLRDANNLIKENFPIWLSGVSPIGCVNYPNGNDIEQHHLQQLSDTYDNAIMVCDDSGVVMIPKHKIEEKIIKKLNYIEFQEDIWFYCLDTLKMTTFDIVCEKKYLSNNLLDAQMLERLNNNGNN